MEPLSIKQDPITVLRGRVPYSAFMPYLRNGEPVTPLLRYVALPAAWESAPDVVRVNANKGTREFEITWGTGGDPAHMPSHPLPTGWETYTMSGGAAVTQAAYTTPPRPGRRVSLRRVSQLRDSHGSRSPEAGQGRAGSRSRSPAVRPGTPAPGPHPILQVPLPGQVLFRPIPDGEGRDMPDLSHLPELYTLCDGCRNGIANQQAHMGDRGCLAAEPDLDFDADL